jgi:PleD family two-component response regulator
MNLPESIEANILLVANETETSHFLSALLTGEGYRVKMVHTPELVLKALALEPFQLIIADFKEGPIDGIQICKSVRANFALRHIPIILLISTKDPMDKIKSVYAGADDFIESPPEAGEFLARIKASLVRISRDLDANPLTKLPGNVSILKELASRIKSKNKFGVGFTDMSKFKEFNDYYGFEKGDKAITLNSRIIIRAIEEFGTPSDFIGHIGGDDFIFISTPECAEKIGAKIVLEFDKSVGAFYNEEDWKRGYIITKDRKGELTKIPPLSISIAIVTNESYPLDHVGAIIQIGTELKCYAKTFKKSIYVTDRRQA